jgi:hypothetical protein
MITEMVAAAADVAVAVENGVAMRRNKQSEAPPPAPPPLDSAAAGFSGSEFLIGMLMLALAVLGAALIVHHGLTS